LPLGACSDTQKRQNSQFMKYFQLTAMLMPVFFAAAQAVAGNSDLEIHCVPKRVDQTMKKASDGGGECHQGTLGLRRLH